LIARPWRRIVIPWRLPLVKWLDQIPYPVLIPVAILLLLSPFSPMPHVVEKLIMLGRGTLTRPLDIFDLLFHLLPALLLALRLIRDYAAR
jgi:hypothetical protein